jgi:uncharacterized protein DUF732
MTKTYAIAGVLALGVWATGTVPAHADAQSLITDLHAEGINATDGTDTTLVSNAGVVCDALKTRSRDEVIQGVATGSGIGQPGAQIFVTTVIADYCTAGNPAGPSRGHLKSLDPVPDMQLPHAPAAPPPAPATPTPSEDL